MKDHSFKKRHAKRYQFDMSAIVEIDEEKAVLARVKNINSRSAYLTTAIRPDEAAEVSVRFIIAGRVSLELPRLCGRVIRTDSGGCAIAFLNREKALFERPWHLGGDQVSGGIAAAAY